MKKIILAGFVASLAFSGVALAQTTTVIVPGEVKTYVLQQTSPSVTYDGTVVVGEPLPDTVEVYPIRSNRPTAMSSSTSKGCWLIRRAGGSSRFCSRPAQHA